jgi:fatty acyl-CoA reductase
VRLRDQLDGKTIGLTGVTGFVGEALLQRILTDLPGTHVLAMVRPKGSNTAVARVEQLLRKKTFATALARHGGDVIALREARVSVLEGDLNHLPELPADIDVLVHCAGDVSFDASIEEAITTNVLGTRALVEKTLDAQARRGAPIHYVHISTAYVSGRRRGSIVEGPVEPRVDWRAETELGLRMPAFIEDASRMPAQLARFRRLAERDHGRAGPLTAAALADERRREWVVAKLKEAGGERGRSLGWTDCYTFTKAMGEGVVEELGATLPCSIVRPSIIESSLLSPYPGWIEGFKMAEPLILAYGRGELPEFPAAADATVDIVPADHVVNAILAVCATTPEPGSPGYYHVSSGARNPLTFNRVYELIREYFDAHPFEATERGSVRLPHWQFPGADSVERLLTTSERAHSLADRLLAHAPRGKHVRKLVDTLDSSKDRLDYLRRYLDLYKPYAMNELRFLDDNTLALHHALDPEDATGPSGFAFDTGVVDWHDYMVNIHCPAITRPIRVMDRARRRRGPVEAPVLRALVPADDVVAAFDMDGTLLSTNVVETYAMLRMPELGVLDRFGELGSILRRLPKYVMAERKDRGGFLRAVYRQYAGADLAALEQIVDEVLAPHILARVSPDALRRVRAHRAAGHRTVLITGEVRPLTRPLASLFDTVIAADLAVGPDGRCTGYLSTPPLVGESRAAWLAWYARSEGFDLARSYAYADSHVDLPMLRAVGQPVAVSPDVALQRAARSNRWPIADWVHTPLSARLQIPSIPLATVKEL